MNRTEEAALYWLMFAFGYRRDQIHFQHGCNPDFILPENIGVEVKRCSKTGIVNIPEHQWLELEKQDNCYLLIYDPSVKFKAFIHVPTIIPPVTIKGCYIKVKPDGLGKWRDYLKKRRLERI